MDSLRVAPNNFLVVLLTLSHISLFGLSYSTEQRDEDGASSWSKECTTDDVVTYYTSVECSYADASACSVCESWSTCDSICGTSATSGEFSCSNSSGALCAFTKLRHIYNTCAEYGSSTTTSLVKSSASSMAKSSRISIPGNKLATVHECDNYAYCEFCEPYEHCNYLMTVVAPKIMGDDYESWLETGFAFVAFSLLQDIESVCDIIWNETSTSSSPVFDASSPFLASSVALKTLRNNGFLHGLIVVALIAAIAFSVHTTRRKISDWDELS